jgi:hypothetical protein
LHMGLTAATVTAERSAACADSPCSESFVDRIEGHGLGPVFPGSE